jgi:RNA 3'-terminal phosphate cyclase (ATP)
MYAGSVALVIQAALPGMLFGAEPSELKILGGTNVDMSPQIDYFRFVFQPVVARMGVNFELRVVRRGTFPKVCMLFLHICRTAILA